MVREEVRLNTFYRAPGEQDKQEQQWLCSTVLDVIPSWAEAAEAADVLPRLQRTLVGIKTANFQN
eukprot:2224695-Amphidinium_carterae.1